ncbi:cytochrome c biogenesis protein CcdA [soil metagenome]
MSVESVLTTFFLGIAAAASPCLLPLYPGFLAFLAAGQGGPVRDVAVPGHAGPTGRPRVGLGSFLLGLVVVAGVLTAIIAVGLVVSALALPLGDVLAVVVPATTLILVVLGLVMLAGRNPFARLATLQVPVVRRHPAGQAYLYGLFMGPVAIPCAGPFFIALLAISVGLVDTGARIGSFVVFGVGFGLPLIVLAALGAVRGQALARAIARRHDVFLRVAGALLIVAAFAEPIRLAMTTPAGA